MKQSLCPAITSTSSRTYATILGTNINACKAPSISLGRETEIERRKPLNTGLSGRNE